MTGKLRNHLIGIRNHLADAVYFAVQRGANVAEMQADVRTSSTRGFHVVVMPTADADVVAWSWMKYVRATDPDYGDYRKKAPRGFWEARNGYLKRRVAVDGTVLWLTTKGAR